MGRQAEVLSSKRLTEDGVEIVDVVCDPGGGANVEAQHFADLGDDSLPLPGDFAALEEGTGSGTEHVTGYHDVKNAGVAKAGEKRIYARAADGSVVSEFWLKGDGSAVFAGILAGWKIECGVDGSVTINGVKFDKLGNLTAPGEIAAHAGTPATKVTLGQHTHGSGTGPTSPPIPGD